MNTMLIDAGRLTVRDFEFTARHPATGEAMLLSADFEFDIGYRGRDQDPFVEVGVVLGLRYADGNRTDIAAPDSFFRALRREAADNPEIVTAMMEVEAA